MSAYHYLESGLDHVFLIGLDTTVDDVGDDCITIPNIKYLHREIALGLVLQEGAMSGAELRFLRHELGLTQAELGKILGKEGQTIGRWERTEHPMEAAEETVLRQLVVQRLGLKMDKQIDFLSQLVISDANDKPIEIDSSNTDDYRLNAA